MPLSSTLRRIYKWQPEVGRACEIGIGTWDFTGWNRLDVGGKMREFTHEGGKWHLER
jgi:hypothetical protein